MSLNAIIAAKREFMKTNPRWPTRAILSNDAYTELLQAWEQLAPPKTILGMWLEIDPDATAPVTITL